MVSLPPWQTHVDGAPAAARRKGVWVGALQTEVAVSGWMPGSEVDVTCAPTLACMHACDQRSHGEEEPGPSAGRGRAPRQRAVCPGCAVLAACLWACAGDWPGGEIGEGEGLATASKDKPRAATQGGNSRSQPPSKSEQHGGCMQRRQTVAATDAPPGSRPGNRLVLWWWWGGVCMAGSGRRPACGAAWPSTQVGGGGGVLSLAPATSGGVRLAYLSDQARQRGGAELLAAKVWMAERTRQGFVSRARRAGKQT